MFTWLRRCLGGAGASPVRPRKRALHIPSISDSLERREVLSTTIGPFVTLPAAVTPIATPAAIATPVTITGATPTAAVAPTSSYLSYVAPQATAAEAVAATTPLPGTVAAAPPTVVYGRPVVQAPTVVKASSVAPPYYAGQPVVPVSAAGISANDLDSDYVQSLYHNVLNRTGNPGEVAGWVAGMGSGLSFQTVAQDFVNSEEHRWDEVDSFYQEFFHRSPDRLAAAYVDALESGTSEESVAEMMLDSNEYQKENPSPARFVEGLYEDVLGRQATAAEVAVWQSDLASGLSRQQVVADFVNSTEAVDQVIDGYYAQFLHRQAASPDQSAWAGMLTPGGSASTVAVGILSTPEYVQDSTQS